MFFNSVNPVASAAAPGLVGQPVPARPVASTADIAAAIINDDIGLNDETVDALQNMNVQSTVLPTGPEGAGMSQAANRLLAVISNAAVDVPEFHEPGVTSAFAKIAESIVSGQAAGGKTSPQAIAASLVAQQAPDAELAADVSRLVLAAMQAATPAEVAAATAMLSVAVREAGPERISAAANTLAELQSASSNPAPNPNAAIGIPLGFLPDMQAPLTRPTGTRTARNRTVNSIDGDDDRKRRTEHLVPSHDEEGKPYTAEERAHWLRVGIDPRRGTALREARAALAARRFFGLELERDLTGVHDFIDGEGEPWVIIDEPDVLRRNEVRAAFADVNAIIVGPDGVTLDQRELTV